VAFYQSKRRAFGFEPNTNMNVTALVDVLLVTLIIFMLVSPTLEHGIDVQLPAAQPYKLSAPAKPVVVSLARGGGVFWNSAPVTEAQLRARLLEAAGANPETQVIVRGDAGIAYGDLIRVLDLVRGAGLVNIGLATQNPGG
jgi:biopolymer transport protein ExbD